MQCWQVTSKRFKTPIFKHSSSPQRRSTVCLSYGDRRQQIFHTELYINRPQINVEAVDL